MKKLLFILSIIYFNSIISQTSTQQCGNVYGFNSSDFFFITPENVKFYVSDYYQVDESYEIPSKVNFQFYFRFPNNQSITEDGLPIIAEDHFEKIRFKLWTNHEYPSGPLNGYGVNVYKHSLQDFGSYDLFKYPLMTLTNGYSTDPNNVDLFLGGQDNFPENDIFESIRLTIFVYVKQEFAHLYPGGTSNRIYQMNVGTVDDITELRYFSRNFRRTVDNDEDGVLNESDNCPDISNPNQEDDDNDGFGNVCDNCINNSNPNQLDTDGDGLGNACDDDDDNDEILDVDDNCPLTPNPNQEDSDGDGIGDECDDIDNNALPNLTISGFTVEVDGTTYDVFGDNDNLPIFKNGEEHIFEITIENDDDGLALTSPYRIFVSESENAYPGIGDTPAYFWRNDNAGSINPNDEETDSFTVTIYDNISILDLEPNNDYWMFVHLDPEDDVDESNENNNDNIYTIKFQYDNAQGRFYLNLGANTLEFNTDAFDQSINGTVNLKIYSLNGLIGVGGSQSITPVNNNQLLVNQQITENQTIDISHLGAGTYAIHINDVYLQKFNKKRRR